MKRKVSTKQLILIVFLVLFSLQFIQSSHSYRNPIPVISGSGFNAEITSGLAFRSDYTLLIDILSGVLNASNSSTSLTVYNDGGTFSFSALNNCMLNVSSPDMVGNRIFDLDINGADSTTQTGRFSQRATITTGNAITITWAWRIESWIGNYTLFALGISGLILMIASPTWCAMTIKKKGLDPDSFEMIMYALLVMCVGFGLVVMWLW